MRHTSFYCESRKVAVMLAAGCVASTICATGMLLLLSRTRVSAEHWPLWKLVLGTLLLVPGQVLPPVLLWQAWRHTYFVIPFLGPPIHVGMGAVWWASVAVVLSYTSAVVYACRRQWAWQWVVLHPCGTVLLLWRGWWSHSVKQAGTRRDR